MRCSHDRMAVGTRKWIPRYLNQSCEQTPVVGFLAFVTEKTGYLKEYTYWIFTRTVISKGGEVLLSAFKNKRTWSRTPRGKRSVPVWVQLAVNKQPVVKLAPPPLATMLALALLLLQQPILVQCVHCEESGGGCCCSAAAGFPKLVNVLYILGQLFC